MAGGYSPTEHWGMALLIRRLNKNVRVRPTMNGESQSPCCAHNIDSNFAPLLRRKGINCSFSKTIPRSRFSLSLWNYRDFLTKDLFTMELYGKFYRMYQIENVEKRYIVILIRKFCLLEILLILWKSINMTNMIITVIILLFHYLSLFLPCKFTRCQQRDHLLFRVIHFRKYKLINADKCYPWWFLLPFLSWCVSSVCFENGQFVFL